MMARWTVCSATGRQSGVALVLVLWVLVILTIMAGSFALSLRRDTELVRSAKGRAEATALAEGGVYHAMVMLLPADEMLRWRADGTPHDFSLAGAWVRVQIFDETGKIDLNYAKDELLLSAVQQAGVADPEQAASIRDAIIDWRDGDVLKRLNGAEAEDYEDAGYAYGPRNQPFQTVEELLLVKGVSAQLYDRLVPLLTVTSRQQGFDPTKAPREVLLAIPGATEEMVDDYLQLRAQSEQQNLPPPAFPLTVDGATGGGGGASYTVVSEAQLENGDRARVEALIVKGRGGGEIPFDIVAWKRPGRERPSLFAEPSE